MNGRHPAAPSRLCQPDGSEVSLAAAIRADPVPVLARECAARFGPRLPFLLKVLALARALSIQVHLSPAQAATGFAEKQAACAAGGRVIQMLARLDVPALRPVLPTLKSEAGQAGPAGVLAILARLATGAAGRAGQLDLRTRTRLARRGGHKPRSRRAVEP